MDRPEQEMYCLADRVFFEQLDRLADTGDRFRTGEQAAPAGWRRGTSSVWTAFQPAGAELPEQGWKVHVSAGLADAEKTIDIVSGYCFSQRLTFKFLRSPLAYLVVNSKGAPRASSGKLLALYPADEAELERTLADLAGLLTGIDGPYILSDLRVGSPLYVRYGGFTALWCAGPDGRAVPAIRRPDGVLVPDERRPAFLPPPWATLPAAVRDRQEASDDELLPYRVLSPLAFSNGGGVYLAEETGPDPRTVVLREARPHAGLDTLGRDAVERLDTEYDTLRRLDGLDCVPRVLGRFTVWEHHFLVEEHIDGRPLLVEMLERNPLANPAVGAGARAAYAAWLADVLDRVTAALAAVHGRGVLWGDVHPANVLVRPDGSVVLIDFEAAGTSALGAPGFAAPASITGAERDHHALDRMALLGAWPHAVVLSVLAPAKTAALVGQAKAALPLPASVRERLDRCLPSGVEPDPADAVFEAAHWPRLRDALTAGILGTATPERTDRLFPGDPEQFRDGPTGLAYGAAGVLYALHAVGDVPSELVDWLAARALADPFRPFGGLCHGPLGAAAVLDRLGRTGEAVAVRAAALDFRPPVPGLAAGRAGVALAALDAAGRADGDRCRDVALRLAAELAADEPPDRTGLLHGPSGLALLYLRIFEHTGTPRWLDLAGRTLRLDVDRLVPHVNGAHYVKQGTKSIVHLAAGSAGVGLVLHEYLRHRDDAPLRAALDRIVYGLTPDYVLEAGLFEGRAGLLAVLEQCRPDAAGEITAQVRGFAAQAVTHDGRLLMAGRLSRRLSTDLATGSAGVLLALHRAFGGATALLPGLGPMTPGISRATPSMTGRR